MNSNRALNAKENLKICSFQLAASVYIALSPVYGGLLYVQNQAII